MTDYEALGRGIGRLVAEKNSAYGESFGKSGAVMRLLYPEGIDPEQYGDALAVVRVVDKLFRIATDRDALGESPWRDIAGYALLGAERVERIAAAKEAAPADDGFDAEASIAHMTTPGADRRLGCASCDWVRMNTCMYEGPLSDRLSGGRECVGWKPSTAVGAK